MRQDQEDSATDSLVRQDQAKNINQTTEGRNVQAHLTVDSHEARKKKYIKWGIIGAIILIIVVLAIVLPIVLTKKGGGDTPPTPPAPFPDNFNPYTTKQEDVQFTGNQFTGVLQAPKITSFDKQLALHSIISNTATEPVKLGVHVNEIKIGDVNNKFIQGLKFNMGMKSWRIAHFTLTDNDNTRYEIPEVSLNKPQDDMTMRLDMLGFTYNLNPFSFTFTDPTDKDNVLLTTQDSALVFMDKYIQMDFTLPSQRIFGFGERVREFQLSEGTWTMWAIGQNSPYDDGTGRYGVYGVHPFILIQGKNKDDFIGMFFRNSNFQSPVLKYNDNGKSTLSYITTGGIIDVYFFMHGTAKDIIQAYQTNFGTPRLPPFWSLGWQQASFKWTTQTMVEDVIGNYSANGFPLDTVYLDIPYMNNFEDFTVDTVNFPDLPKLSQTLHDNNQHIVLIIDAAISAENTESKYYKTGNDDSVYIKSSLHNSTEYGDNLISRVWPKKAVFVDWFNDKCTNVWSVGLNDLYTATGFDGIWIDMNEPTTFEHGEIDTSAKTIFEEPSKFNQARFLLQEDAPVNYTWFTSFEQKDLKKVDTFNLPFVPQYGRQWTGNFDNWTLSLNATNNAIGETQYNVHSLYGHMMSKRTFEFLTTDKTYNKTDNRPFILTRSTFASTGRYASHWLGDNFRQWRYLNYSIAGIMNMNMFGIPHVGSDVCGFFGVEKDDEMCARWIQLAQFYPLARLHYDNESNPTEPYLMEQKYKDLAKRAMLDRMQYLRHIYTCLFEAYKFGGTCFDPLLYYFPTDDKVFQEIESTFIVGGALKVTPVLNKLADNQTTQEAYFPSGKWANIYDNSIVTGNQSVNLTVDGKINVHIKPGSLFAFQDNSKDTILKTSQLFQEPISLYVNRDENNAASGTLFLDNGLSMSELNSGTYEYYTFNLQANSLSSFLSDGNRGSMKHVLGKIRIFNAGDLVNVSRACYIAMNMSSYPMTVDNSNNYLDITPDQESPLKFSEIHSIHFAAEGEVSPCGSQSFQYQTLDGTFPDLTSATNASFTLKHVPGQLPNIKVTLRLLENEIVNIKWTWANDDVNGTFPKKRTPFDVPQDLIATDGKTESTTSFLGKYVTLSDAPFSLNVTYRNDTPSTIFSLTGLLYDEYLNWVNVRAYTQITGDNFKGVFGLGERANKDFFYKDGVYSMHTRDSLTPDETGKLPGNNMYGVHPFYMYKFASNAWVGVFHKLAQAQDWWITNNNVAGTIDLKQIAIGGVTDIYIMQGTTPDGVISKYFSIVGNPVLTPQWTLGWNQCKWGYTTLDQLKAVVQGYESFSIPYDVQWSDIDYLNKYRNFEYDKDNFEKLPDFIKELHGKGMKYVPILDAGLAYRPDGDYAAFNDGVQKDVFMKINDNKTIFIGQVWPNDAAYPDYFAANTATWWQTYLTNLHNNIEFDGLWEDMNEASNFCNGICYQKQKPAQPVKQKLKYIPSGRDLETKSISLDAHHANGVQQIDTHSIYGTQMVKTTHDWFTSQNKRTFILERSSFAGAGKFTSRWLGDNFSNEQQMSYSVSGVMLMNMFGITLAGSDICGFIGDTNKDLCSKWHIVGSFYPFSRNHNNWGQKPQEPYVFANDTTSDGKNVTDLMRDAIKTKYSLIRYYYSKMFSVSVNGTGSFYKPLFFEFPEDSNAYSDIVYNVMLGDALKLSINPESLTLATKGYYFPSGKWCLINGTGLTVGACFTSVGETKTMNSGISDFQLHIREGKIVPMQDTHNSVKSFKTSADLQTWGVDFHILGEATNEANATYWQAYGTYTNDDGISLDYQTKHNHYDISATSSSTFTIAINQGIAAQGQTYSKTANCTAVNQNDFVEKIYIYNSKEFGRITDMTVNALLYPDETTSVKVGTAVYDSVTDRLVFTVAYNDQTALCLSTIKELQFV